MWTFARGRRTFGSRGSGFGRRVAGKWKRRGTVCGEVCGTASHSTRYKVACSPRASVQVAPRVRRPEPPAMSREFLPGPPNRHVHLQDLVPVLVLGCLEHLPPVVEDRAEVALLVDELRRSTRRVLPVVVVATAERVAFWSGRHETPQARQNIRHGGKVRTLFERGGEREREKERPLLLPSNPPEYALRNGDTLESGLAVRGLVYTRRNEKSSLDF